MTIAVIVLLSAALVFLLWMLQRQNRALAELRDAVRHQRPWLRETDSTGDLPAWSGLVAEVNSLITAHTTLNQQRTDQLAQLDATLGNLREAVLIVDESNYVHFANRALRDIFPAARDLVNLRLELIVRSSPFLEYVRATRQGQELPRAEFEIIDGQNLHWIEVSGARIPSPDGKASWALFVIHDLTNQRKLERVRRDFVANASHELRTPLSIIKGYVETLVDGHETMPLEDRAKFLKTIQRHSERLKFIIDDLLALSRLESSTPGLTFAPLALGPFLSGLADDYRHRPAAAGHELTVQVDPELTPIDADAEKLTQVFGNLIENALKYTPKGTRVEIGVHGFGIGHVECYVRDSGAGIPAEDLPHIFERFFRVEKGRSRETGGTGLGLSIVKHIVQLHGGEVWAENRDAGGLAIRVRLPRSQARKAP